MLRKGGRGERAWARVRVGGDGTLEASALPRGDLGLGVGRVAGRKQEPSVAGGVEADLMLTGGNLDAAWGLQGDDSTLAVGGEIQVNEFTVARNEAVFQFVDLLVIVWAATIWILDIADAQRGTACIIELELREDERLRVVDVQRVRELELQLTGQRILT
jgi:hypothetical protein